MSAAGRTARLGGGSCVFHRKEKTSTQRRRIRQLADFYSSVPPFPVQFHLFLRSLFNFICSFVPCSISSVHPFFWLFGLKTVALRSQIWPVPAWGLNKIFKHKTRVMNNY